MSIHIRNEEPRDFRRVEEIAKEAFWNLYFPGCHEHFVIHKMREHADFIKELAFVIEIDGNVEGAIFYTHSKIISEINDPNKLNKEYKTISFGPVCISPEFHRKGFGGKLITHSINIAKEMGYKAILTLGYPYHYEPYGFLRGKKYNISMPDYKFYKGLLVLPLYTDAIKNISGYAMFSDVFEVNNDELDEYDNSFAYKEKKFQESQIEFEISSTMLDE